MRVLLVAALLLAPGWSTYASDERAIATKGFEVPDYFQLRRFQELALSSDGEWLAYVVTWRSLEEERQERAVYLHRPGSDSPAWKVPALVDARSLQWIPGTASLAFISNRSGSTQVFAYEAPDGGVRQITEAKNPVETFRFASQGGILAYTIRPPVKSGESLYRQFRDADSGILVDPATTSSHDFLNPDWHSAVKRPPAELWVNHPELGPRQVEIPGHVRDGTSSYHWSPDGRQLSVVYVDRDVPPGQMRGERTSLGVHNTSDGAFQVVAATAGKTGAVPHWSFRGGEWLPDGDRLLIRRINETDPWVSWAHQEWAVIDPEAGLSTGSRVWNKLEVYPRDLQFFPLDRERILVENTVAGVHSLFTVTPDRIERVRHTENLAGSHRNFHFASGGSLMAFIGESLTSPPEIYLQRNDSPPIQVSRLNREIESKLRFTAREVTWQGAANQTIHGWLLEPRGSEGPLPLVVHVHGGPAYPYPNAFAPYFEIWPYPFEVLAERGFAVFFPNYRGTHTYGRRIASPEGDEPESDILDGVRAMIDSGVADPERLAITGHSHGAYLGPRAMVKSREFMAASFAEGISNAVVMYELMSLQANLEIHDRNYGVSLYDAPQRYIEDSPGLQFQGLSTAALFESGAYTAAIYMLGFAKAARRAGMPSEFVVYPRTRHNLSIPSLMRESACRNLHWLESRLRGRVKGTDQVVGCPES